MSTNWELGTEYEVLFSRCIYSHVNNWTMYSNSIRFVAVSVVSIEYFSHFSCYCVHCAERSHFETAKADGWSKWWLFWSVSSLSMSNYFWGYLNILNILNTRVQCSVVMINGNSFDECQMFGIVFKSIYCVIVATFVIIITHLVTQLYTIRMSMTYIKSNFSVRDSVRPVFDARFLLGILGRYVCVCVCHYNEY